MSNVRERWATNRGSNQYIRNAFSLLPLLSNREYRKPKIDDDDNNNNSS